MSFDRFDIVEAHYCYCAEWHSGMHSPEYYRLSRMGFYFRPRPNLSSDTLEPNGKEIYDALVARYQRKDGHRSYPYRTGTATLKLVGRVSD